MDLFGNGHEVNLLPCDGTVNYHGCIFTADDERKYFDALLHHIPWQHDEVVIFGKRIVTAREVAWYGDSGFAYTYSGTTKQALPWTAELSELRHTVERLTGMHFNSCLLNLYHHGGEGMAWHSDDEKSLGEEPCIVSLSFGADRKFSFKHKRAKLTVSLILQSASLLVMKGATQANWLHSVPKSKKVTAPRINLTFRRMLPQRGA